jgi:hypothetical protein
MVEAARSPADWIPARFEIPAKHCQASIYN